MTEIPDIFFWGIIQILVIPMGVIFLWRILINSIMSK